MHQLEKLGYIEIVVDNILDGGEMLFELIQQRSDLFFPSFVQHEMLLDFLYYLLGDGFLSRSLSRPVPFSWVHYLTKAN